MRRRSAAMLVVLLVAGSCDASPERAATVVESHSPAIGGGGTLEQAVGLETLGGVLTPLLHVGCKVPCESNEVFSTAADNQTQISLRLFRGNAPVTTEATALGEFRIEGIPPMPRGAPKIKVRLAAESGTLLIEASDASTRQPFRVIRVTPPR